MWWVALWVIALVVVKLSHWFYKWANPKCNGKLPPGFMGLPIIGETTEFFKPHGFHEIPPFIKKRVSRHGSLFRTSILGSKVIISTDPEVNFEIFRQENKSFVLTYPSFFFKVSGKDNLFLKQGQFHKYIRQLTLQFIGPEGLKRKIIHDMDRATLQHLKVKASQGVFDVKDAAAELILEFLAPLMISDIEPETKRKLIDNSRAFSVGWYGSLFSLSVWKAFYDGLTARKEADKLIKEIFSKRKASEANYGDFLDTLLGELEKEGTILDEGGAIAQIFGLLSTAQDNTSKAIALAVKFISENPKVLAELKKENEAIIKNKTDKESGMTWEEYRSSINFTHMVINESLRLATLSPTMFREAVEDVEIKGYTIPAGWTVLLAPSILHYDPEVYENPCEFNPWRWELLGKELLSGSKTFMAFGGGARLCVGAEYARLQIALFLHHLVTKYDFSSIQDVGITRTPLLQFTKGMRISISESRK